MDHTLPEDEAIAQIMQATKVSEIEARFIYAIETGEIDGDAVDQDGIDRAQMEPNQLLAQLVDQE